MSIWIIVAVIIIALATSVDWGDLFFDPERDGEKRPAPDQNKEGVQQSRRENTDAPQYAEIEDIESENGIIKRYEKSIKTGDSILVERYQNGTLRAAEFDLRTNQTTNKSTPKNKLELTGEEIAAMNEYNEGPAIKARIKLIEKDFQTLKACFLLGLSAEKTYEVHPEINLRLIKGYLKVYNQVHRPDKKIKVTPPPSH